MKSQIVVRLDPKLKELLMKISKLRGEDVSDFVRRAIKMELARLSYLDKEDIKALGIKEAQHDV